jgi:sterol desaturase/sphingolipid hydroxylase (fatty acid hydroxylase superfamily)
MPDILLTLELLIRLAGFGCIFAAMAAWEILAPRREQTLGRAMRWPGNIGNVVLDTILVRLLFPMTALFHALDLPAWVGALFAVMALDLAIYLQHVLFHAVPVLSRLHRMHHAYQDRRHDRGALPSDRDPPLDGHQRRRQELCARPARACQMTDRSVYPRL